MFLNSKLFLAAILCISYLFIFFSIYIIHINFFDIAVLLYASLIDSFLAAILLVIILFFLRKNFNYFEVLLIWIINLLIGYCLSISIPTVIDRSLSFYILEKINHYGDSIKFSSMEHLFINEYLPEHKLADVRVTEQINSGTIVLSDDCVILTEKGKRIVKFSLFFRKNLLPKKRVLIDRVTDDLITFIDNKENKSSYNYNCK